jgi:hypothetical protein
MPSPSVLTLNYKIVFYDVGRRSVNLDLVALTVTGSRVARGRPFN